MQSKLRLSFHATAVPDLRLEMEEHNSCSNVFDFWHVFPIQEVNIGWTDSKGGDVSWA